MPGCLGDGETGHESKCRTLLEAYQKYSLPLTIVNTVANNLIMKMGSTLKLQEWFSIARTSTIANFKFLAGLPGP